MSAVVPAGDIWCQNSTGQTKWHAPWSVTGVVCARVCLCAKPFKGPCLGYAIPVRCKKIIKKSHTVIKEIWLPRLICARKRAYDFYAFLWPNRCLLEGWEEKEGRRCWRDGFLNLNFLTKGLAASKGRAPPPKIRKQLLLTEARHKQNNIVQFHGPPSKTSLTTQTRRQWRDAVAIKKWQRFWKYTQINNACRHRSLWHCVLKPSLTKKKRENWSRGSMKQKRLHETKH